MKKVPLTLAQIEELKRAKKSNNKLRNKQPLSLSLRKTELAEAKIVTEETKSDNQEEEEGDFLRFQSAAVMLGM